MDRETSEIDSRIHGCLFFINPNGHRLQPLEIYIMKKIDQFVNIIPVIGKADTMTSDELNHFKKRVIADMVREKIRYFREPHNEKKAKIPIPFAIVGAGAPIEHDGKCIRGRAYPWGLVDIDDPKQSDFCQLRNFLLYTHIEGLKHKTHKLIYDTFRTEKLVALNATPGSQFIRYVDTLHLNHQTC